MEDYRTLQRQIVQIQTDPSNVEDYYEQGYVVLRQCVLDAQTLLAAHFDPTPPATPDSNDEQERTQLQRVLLDAGTRRFQAQKIYQQATAAERWAHYREGILQGARPQAAHAAALQATTHHLRAELSLITDESVYGQLSRRDRQAGRWTAEDPSLQLIRQWSTFLH
ncbi:MAG: hypothetical protein M1838_001003 [Thelocarpon superellum]|nr:MAG: hypothetical protein M1838_001003 [Thelocarpon superellum]